MNTAKRLCSIRYSVQIFVRIISIILWLRVCEEELIDFKYLLSYNQREIHEESTNPLVDVQTGHIWRRNRELQKLKQHQMRMKLDVGNFAKALLR
jgi:hypothetical protein